MKISIALVAAFVTVACLFQSTSAETEATTFLRVNANTQGAICYKAQQDTSFNTDATSASSAPTARDLCFNPATSLFQHGCDAGFKCSHGKCVYKTTTTITTTVAAATSSEALPAHAPICYKACPTGQYCPRGETECRAPTGDLCFNPATSLFQHGCSRGFKCSHGKCVYQ
ncbi:hypothetical protein PHYSODRAFT_252882 [Phytophthora sojae]|uniref:Uncharacterized protein n=1 Tax=Phytophthora sojae (strain P6497) TaxID=1094619 RepID=G4ZK02_PHYSP|nr:hypothetical protein PHYSODRAFT_252882 [Phytophthora sojae]EGZ14484.1 hypothetical protein PHYSODRAFT_252882 [Phytophthora sojae]|eukprot:XP_009528233.1 hypothetical protein PHYSODRAFT_252882 [Phytophthora sojae]